MLRADKKAMGKWKDLPVPFPPRKKDTPTEVKKDGVSQLPTNLRHLVQTPNSVAPNKQDME